MTSLGVWVVVGWMVLVAFTGILFMIWGWESKQFKDIEEAKYRMLEDREPEPWPEQSRKGNES
ncbi:MAG: cbb3-type cytochrome oxidase assembly protein [Anaerolineaceae bacterium]|nr:cbb3-type cytochrome oxidase assembly protein [Anaerolineaceae bacterium]